MCSLWSKGVERSREDKFRIEDLNNGLVYEFWSTRYIDVKTLFGDYKKLHQVEHVVDLSRPQFIKWNQLRRDRLSLKYESTSTCFVITDPKSNSYVFYNSKRNVFTSAKYDENVVSDRENTKSSFVDTMKRQKKTSMYLTVLNLTDEDLRNLKRTLGPVNTYVNEWHVKDKEKVRTWLRE